MIRQTVFIFGFIWIITGAASLLLGPFVGFNRIAVLRELKEFYAAKNVSIIKTSVRLLVYWIAYLGFLLPATRQFTGISIGLLLIVLGGTK